MDYLDVRDAIRLMPKHYYIIFYALWIFDLLNSIPPAEIYTLKSQLTFMAISVVFAFGIGFVFGARMETCPY